MSILRKIKDAVEGVKETVRALDEVMPPLPKKPEPSPKKDDSRKAKSVVAPTPLSGGCSLRLLQAAGFAGVVAVTASAALMGRYRR